LLLGGGCHRDPSIARAAMTAPAAPQHWAAVT
jgi:hypothetical protein